MDQKTAGTKIGVEAMYCNPQRLLWRNLLTQCVGFCVLTSLLLALNVQAAPRTPASDTEVLEKLPTRAGDNTARELSSLRAALVQAPKDEAKATELATRYFDLAMARGDPRYIGYADAVVQRFPATRSAPLLTLRGMLRQYRHDFAGALNDFDTALKQDPSYADAYAWRGAIFLVKADHAAAQQACDGLQRLKRDVLAGGCLGLTQAYGGQLDAGYQTRQKTLDQAGFPDNQLWLLTRLGEVAAWHGKTAQAEAHYRAALALGRDDVYLLAAWSDFQLDAGQPAEVVKWLQPWESADGLLLRLAEAETALKLPDAARHRQMLADRFAAARARATPPNALKRRVLSCVCAKTPKPRCAWQRKTTPCSASRAMHASCWKRPSRRKTLPAPSQRAIGCAAAALKTPTRAALVRPLPRAPKLGARNELAPAAGLLLAGVVRPRGGPQGQRQLFGHRRPRRAGERAVGHCPARHRRRPRAGHRRQR